MLHYLNIALFTVAPFNMTLMFTIALFNVALY